MSALPLTIRKNIRDAEPKLKENLEKINQATGKEWICEVDFPSNVAQIDGYGKDTIGNLYYDEVLGNLAQNITNLCKTETSKEAFNEATSANKIVIKVDEKAKDYWIISISNGELVLTHKKQIANTNNVTYFDLVSVIPTPGIPLVSKLNIEENQPKLEEHLQTIAEATGVSDWTLEVDFAGIVPKLEEYSQKNVGNIYYNEMLGAFANNIKRTMKNEILKEAFLEATSERKIEIQLNDKIKDYNQISFLNGTVIISHKKSIANVHQIDYTDLAPIIPVPGLPLVAKLNLAENEEKLQANLERINAATGSSGWSLEVDIPAILPQLGQYEQNRIGSIYYDEVMDNLSRLLENKLKVETIKEAFIEAASNQKIVLRVNDKAKDYWDIKFENGNVVVEHKKNIANVNNVGYFPLEKVIPTPGLTLVVKLNIEEYHPKLTEALDKINQATGEQDWTVEIDYERILPQLDEYSRNNIGSIYSEALNNLGDNLIRKLASETIKEAFNEATSEKKVIVSIGDAKQSNYWDIKFQNGNLLLSHKKQIANLNEVSYYEIEKIIPVPGVLSLVSKLNIEEFQEKKEEHLQVIKDTTGSDDYTFDDGALEVVYPKLGDYEKNRIGDLFLNEALGNLASNLKKALGDEMVKEAFCEVATSHLITIQHDPKQSNYWTISFKDGNIVLSFKQIANMNEIQYFDIEKIL